MRIFRHADTPMRPADLRSFSGSAETKLIGADETAPPVHVYRVEFRTAGRTNWHRHSGPQWLLVTDGRIRVQVWGEAALEVGAGDAVVFSPGEKHWHGAAPGAGYGTHVAVNVDVKTEWLEPVTDDQYLGDKPS